MGFMGCWCRRGDSNPHELPHTPLKRARLPVPPLRHLGRSFTSYFEGSGDAVDPVDVGTAAGAAAEGVGCGVGVAAGACSGLPDCNTELVPLMNGSDKHNATN